MAVPQVLYSVVCEAVAPTRGELNDPLLPSLIALRVLSTRDTRAGIVVTRFVITFVTTVRLRYGRADTPHWHASDLT